MARIRHIKIKLSPLCLIAVLAASFILNVVCSTLDTFADNVKCAQWTLKVNDDTVQTDQLCASVNTDGNASGYFVNESGSGYGNFNKETHNSGSELQGTKHSVTTVALDCRNGWNPVSGHDCDFEIYNSDHSQTWAWNSLIEKLNNELKTLEGDYRPDGSNANKTHSELTYTGDYFTNSAADTKDSKDVEDRSNLAGYDANGRVNGWTDRQSCLNGELSRLITEALNMTAAPDSAKTALRAVQHKTDDFAKRRDALNKFYDSLQQQQGQTKVDEYKAKLAAIESEDAEPCPGESNTDYYAETSASNQLSNNGDACYNNADSWGWVLCSILESAGGATEALYTDFIEPELNLEPQLFSPDNGTFDAWAVFRNFANIAFIIFLVVVILSQLTGVGIDNYGIKKTLPKLILMAVMINLSFIICQLAIDISNILGTSLEGLFDWISGNISGNVSGADLGNSLGAVLLVLTGLGAGATAAVVLTGWALVVPALLAVLSGFLSVLFLFVILGVRKAAMVLLVAIAPLALACYILPNTKPWFDRWLKIFKALLFVYPLCGLLLGAGHLAGTMLLAVSDDFLMNVVAMIVYLGPVFAIPALLRSTIAAADGALGKLISRGQGLNGNIRNAAGSAMRNSVRYQDYTKQRRGQRSLRYSNRVANRLSGRNNLNAAQQRQLAYHSAAVDSARQDQLRGAMATFRNSDGTYDDNGAAKYLERMATQDDYSSDDLVMMEAAATRVAATDPLKFGKLFDGGSQAFRSKFANIGMNNSSIRSAIAEGDIATMEYMKGINKGNEESANIIQQGRTEYANQNWSSIIDSASSGAAILGQKGDTRQEMLNNMTLSQLEDIRNNERIMSGASGDAKNDLDRAIEAQRRNLDPQAYGAQDSAAPGVAPYS